MSILNTLKENSVLIAVVGAGYFLFFRNSDRNSPTAQAMGPGGTATYWGNIR